MLTPNQISPASERRPLPLACLCVAVALLGCDPEREDDAVVREQISVDCEGSSKSDGGLAGLDAGTLDTLDGGGELADADAGEGDAEVDGGDPVEPVEPSPIRVLNVVANGSGCPQGTSTVLVHPGGIPFGAKLADMHVDLTPNRSLDTRSCQVAIELAAPPDISYTVTDVAFEGHAKLEAGASANLNVLYYFSGVPLLPNSKPKVLTGPYDDAYQFRERATSTDAKAWSPCGAKRDLNVRASISTTNRSGAPGRISVGSILVLELATRKCP